MAPPARAPAMGQAAPALDAACDSPAMCDKLSLSLAYGRDSEDEIDGDDEEPDGVDVEEDEDGELEGDDEERWLDAGILIQAMGKWNQLYNKRDRIEFYGMVAEEYSRLDPDYEGLSMYMIERNELALRRYALAILSGNAAPEDLQLPHNVKAHERNVLMFYKIMVEVGHCKLNTEGTRSDVGSLTLSPSNQPESPVDSVHSNAEQTDGSASNPATPVVEEAPESVQPLEKTAVVEESSGVTVESEQNEEETTVVVRSGSAAATSSTLTLPDPNSGKLAYRQAWELIAGLTNTNDESDKRLRQVEERLQAERALVTQRKQEFKHLKTIVKSYRVRDKEKKRLAAEIENGGKDEGKKAPRTEERRCKECDHVRETLQLQLELLKSRAKNSDMEVERKVADLERLCLDSDLFGDLSFS